jgi:ATP-dependent Lon protease
MLTRSKVKISEKQFREILEKNSKKEKENVRAALSRFKNAEIIKMIGMTHPWLNIKETTFPGLKYDEEDKEYIKSVYGSLSNYDYDYEEDSDSEEEIDDSEDVKFFMKLNKTEKNKYLDMIKHIEKHNKKEMPLRFKLLSSDMDISTKSMVIRKIDELDKMNEDSSEYHKMNYWIQNLMQIPFNHTKNLQCNRENTPEEISDYLINSKNILDSVVYGHQKAKSQIIQIIAQLITNPNAMGNVFGIQGPMGNGKTTLLKDGLAKSLDRPFKIIQLGGATDSSFLEGHSYTYEGSQWGQIVDILMQTKCMNPIIYFDELDKVSNTYKGEEIIGILTHLTDPSQNNHFHDKYFAGIDIDLSKALIVFSFNDESKINKILLDRIHIINTKGYQNKDKIRISRDFLIPDIMQNTGFEHDNIIISDNIINYIIEFYTKEEGVRQLKRCIEMIVTRVNLLSLIQNEKHSSLDLPFKVDNFQLPFTITQENINQLVDKKDLDKPPFGMYC